MSELETQFGQIDIYLFDQLLRGRVAPPMRVLDAGCGHGRNLVYLLRSGCEVFAVDTDPLAIDEVRRLALALAPGLPAANFRVEPVERLTFADASMDVVICSAVLHFSKDDDQFEAMIDRMARVLAPGGLMFCRLASTIGIEALVRPVAGRRCALPDGTERYLVDEAMLMAFTQRVDGRLVDPLKTTVVQNQRAMTTWVVRKGARA